MTEIPLRPGEMLRIENQDGRVLTLFAPPGAGPWEIRFGARRERWWKRWIRSWREDRQARRLALLDRRLLADIGLSQGAGTPLATRIRAYQQDELRRAIMVRHGLM
jgi:hypothetical protein